MAIAEEARLWSVGRAHEHALVLAATPVGPLAHAIDAYRQAVAVRIGINAAHRAVPHVVLARCQRRSMSVAACRVVLVDAMVPTRRSAGQLCATVSLSIDPSWHGLEVDSPSLESLATEFVSRAGAATPGDTVIRCDRLRLALAYEFAPADHDALAELAHRIVDPSLAARWDVGLFEFGGG